MSAVRIERRPRCAARALACSLVLILLAGCAALRPQPASPPSTGDPAAAHAAHLAALRAFDRFRLAGRIAVQREDKGFSADLDWQDAPPTYSLRVSAPLSGGAFALNGGPAGVTLAAPKGQSYTAADAETLMREHLGWDLPLAGARYWVRGLPAPDSPVVAEHLDTAGRWTDFSQDGWRVSVLEYAPSAGLTLPKRLFLVRDKLQVRMAIKNWERR